MKWKIIAAMDENRLIGRDNRLPWRIPEDIAWYQSQTDGQLMLMGRKTFEGIRRRPEGSRYIVLSDTVSHYAPDQGDVTILKSLDHLLSLPLEGEGWICGGGLIYEAMLPFADELVLTQVKGRFEGDTYFPPFEHLFEVKETLVKAEAFKVVRYKRRKG